jgi:hypothetical protein
MSNFFFIAGVGAFAVFSILSLYAALRGKTLTLIILLACLAVACGSSIYGIHMRSLEGTEPGSQVFTAVDLSQYELGNATAPPSPSLPNQAAFAALLAALDAGGASSPADTSGAARPPDAESADTASDSIDAPDSVGTYYADSESSEADAPPNTTAYTKYVISDLDETDGGISPIEREDQLRRQHLSIIEKRYREFIESQ